jgi:ferredoxin-NADP reductase
VKEETMKKLKVSVKGNIRDLLAFKNLTSQRRKNIDKASEEFIKSDPVNNLAQVLHPSIQNLMISEIKEETKSAKTFRLIHDPDSNTEKLAYFRAGQFLSLKVDVDGTPITRPYSISSSPSDALRGFYEITIRKEDHGFLTEYIWDNWDKGTKIKSSGPNGYFYYDPIRDSKEIIGIAGGSGITPFRSMVKEIMEGKLNIILTLLYGSSEEDDILFYGEFKEYEGRYPEKIKIIHVLSCEEVSLEGCEQGFITAGIIEKYCAFSNSSVFICGPQVMYDFIDKELSKFQLPENRIRKEVYGEVKDVVSLPNYPKKLAEKSFKIKVRIGNLIKNIPANANESILVAMERAKLAPPSVCRSGQCGFCRSKLISGEIFANPKNDGRRAADKILKYFHPCSSYPLSNLEIEVPRS